ncbi:class I SAM-dependent methyltransferase [Lentzea sp.]|uniref:class I SAM-dependent methyltransferase n=1 Tax=Lentzea sp. TaxID=56099 RepID=UPI002CDDA5B8|nr:class I SAM-dependent methyltransferase [Lentzea sp.]HUQ58450.1 class I SAM-dependent methyltransferase [Lentzea sp.]
MLERVRRGLQAKQLRHKLRVKAIELVQDAIAPQREQIQRLQVQIDGLRDELRSELAHQANRIVDHSVEQEVRTRRDIVFAADQEAALQSARFVQEHMPRVPHFGTPQATLEHALAHAPAEGMALEFGVYTGGTLKVIANARDGEVYGFDSFEGLPEDWRNGFPAGTFTMDGLPDVPGAELVPGWFDETLPKFLEEHQGPVTLLHVDCDLYSSTKTVLDLVGPRLVEGSVVIFDEYFNYPQWQEHEHKAWMEHVEAHGVEFDYLGYTYDHEQVVVKVTKV